ncbi:hypothetical protein [Caulobacter sp. NIBR2454]|uniref:hypothetical protein n=1 Tax=Caulobacter sp. NIBR2454 TaxID=3015996 RepID=UPI0022B61913|nr:hypothetical protein [Caulobacter sp. NIBR2454]
MKTRSKIAAGLGLLASAAALVGTMAAPTVSMAQSSGYYDSRGGYYYDPCRRDTTTRGTTGGLAGAGLGALIGGGLASSGVKAEGAVLGGLLGAVAGSAIGRNGAACTPGQRATYAPPPPPPPPEVGYYDNRDYYDRYQDRYSARYDDHDRFDDRARPVAEARGDAGGCSLAESPIHLPDGRIQKRFVRVCQDANGDYQVVD